MKNVKVGSKAGLKTRLGSFGIHELEVSFFYYCSIP